MHEWLNLIKFMDKQSLRTQLLQLRHQLPKDQRLAAEQTICKQLESWIKGKSFTCLGAYWPICDEVDIRSWLQGQLKQRVVALPFSQPKTPLIFLRWSSETPMGKDGYNIPAPQQHEILQPDCLLIPCLGFDKAGYRIGYGAGLYDRTLSYWRAEGCALPFLIGVAFSCGEIATGSHQPHDVALNLIVTETSLIRLI